MNVLKNLSIGTRFYGSIALMVLGIVVVGMLGIGNVAKIGALVTDMYEKDLTPAVDVANVNMLAIYTAAGAEETSGAASGDIGAGPAIQDRLTVGRHTIRQTP